jgi:UDP-N-acetylmuramate-alanine ligase
VPVLAGGARVRYFPCQRQIASIRGIRKEIPHLGLPRDYYAWTWGDALFVVIDPYWHSPVQIDEVLVAMRQMRKAEEPRWLG